MPSRLALLVLGALCLVAAFAARAATGGATDSLSLAAVLVPALAGGILLLAASGSPGLRSALLVVALSAAAALWAADLYLALDARGSSPGMAAPSGYEEVARLRKEGRPAYPAMVGRELLTDRDGALVPRLRAGGKPTMTLGGISGVETVYCGHDKGFLVYRADEHGFHNPPGLWPAEGTRVDIAAIGDSFIHGACVASDENLVARLRERVPSTLNLGIAGNGPLLELAILKEYAARVRPRVVLWFYYEGNDLSKDLFEERAAPVLMAYLEPGHHQNLAERQAEIDATLKAEADRLFALEPNTLTRSASVRAIDVVLLRNLRHQLGLGLGRADVPLYGRVLAEAKRTVEAWGGRLYVVYLPSERRYAGMLGRVEQNALRWRVLDEVAAQGLTMIDLTPAFDAAPDPRALFAGHYNAEGYALAARTVLDRLAADPEYPLR